MASTAIVASSVLINRLIRCLVLKFYHKISDGSSGLSIINILSFSLFFVFLTAENNDLSRLHFEEPLESVAEFIQSLA